MFDDCWLCFGLDFIGELCDLDVIFGCDVFKVLEIGFGNGVVLCFVV